LNKERFVAAGLVVLLAAAAAPGQDSGPTAKTLIPSPAPAPAANGNVDYYLKHTYGPKAFVKAGGSAAWSQWRDTPVEWGQGGDGYGRRLASSHGRRVIKNTIDLGVANLRGEVLRYSRCQCDGFWARTRHALKYTFLRQASSGGGTTLAFGRIAGSYGSGMASLLWYPDSRNNLGDGFRRGTTCLGFDVSKNVFREFWPDIKKKLFRR
jgi:hypothetical protein